MPTQERLWRDLVWCLTSAPLMSTDLWSALPLPQRALLSLPEPSHPHRFRLGHHFEQLLATWLDHDGRWTLVTHNLQVQDGKRTVGEFDFIVCEGNQHQHWEAAVKFYLGTGNGLEMADWFGPNTTDRFDIKYGRLINHQLRLSADPQGKATLHGLQIDEIESRCFMKGRLFHPWARFSAGNFAVPAGVNPDHERGWWMTYADYLAAWEDAGYRFVYLPKGLWLSELCSADILNPLSYWELAELLAAPQIEQATHIAVLSGDREIHRGFIVTDRWLTRINDTDSNDGTIGPHTLNGEWMRAGQ